MMRFVTTIICAIIALLLSVQLAAAGPVFFAALSGGASFGAALGATTVGTFLTTFTGRMLTSVALSALQAATRAKPKTPGIVTEQTATGGTNPAGFVIGQYATAGDAVCPPMTHGVVGKTPNAYLTYVVALGDIAGQTLERVAIDGAWVDLGPTPHADYGLPVTGKYAGFAWVKYYDGSQTVADPMLIAKYGSYPERPWLADMVGTGVPYAICTFRFSRKLFQAFPAMLFQVGGIKMYDPRKDTTVGGSGAHRWDTPSTYEPSRNNAVLIYNIARGITISGLGVWGGGFGAEDLPVANWFAAMNTCDTTIGTPAVAQFQAGYEVRVDMEPATVIEELLKGCLGQTAEVGGALKIRIGGPGLPVMFITDDDLVVSKPQDFDPFPAADQRRNGVDAKYPDPATIWKPKSAPSRYNATWEAEDGSRRMASLDLTACPYPDQVQRVMAAYIADERRFRRHGMTLPPDAAILEPLDVISWTSVRNGYASKQFDISQIADDVLTLLQRVSAREVDPTDYSWSTGSLIAVSVPSAEPVVPATQTLSAWTVTPVSIADAAGTARRAAIKMTWSTSDMDGVDSVQYQVRVAATGVVIKVGTTTDVAGGAIILAEGILPDVLYQAQGLPIARSRDTSWTAWTDCTAPSTGFTNADFVGGAYSTLFTSQGLYAIRDVTSLPGSGSFIGEKIFNRTDGKLYQWTGSAWQLAVADVAAGAVTATSFASGVRPIEIVSALPTTGNFQGRTVMLTTDNKIYRHTGSPTGSAGFTAVVPATDLTGQVAGSQIADSAISLAKFASGIQPVEVLAALPTTGNFQGRTVFLTTDNKLYRHTGSPTGSAGFTSVVPAADLTGQVAGSQIADSAISLTKFASGIQPVEVLATLPTTGNFQGRTVFLTTDNKLYRHTGSPTGSAGFTSVVPAADLTGQVAGSQIADSAISLTKFASGLTPVEVVATLPTVGNFTGRTVMLTTDGKLYRYASGAFTRAIDGADITANSIVAGKIAAGAIGADEIAAGAITAQHMLLQPGNLISNSKFVSGDLTDWRSWQAPAQQSVVPRATAGVPTGAPTLNVAKFTATAAAQQIAAFNGSPAYTDAGSERTAMPMLPGRSYRVFIQAAEDATFAATTFYVGIYWRKTDGTIASLFPVSAAGTLDSTWREFSGVFTAPADLVYAWAYVYFIAGGAGSVYWTNLSVREMAAAELVVDGTITAAKIAAGTITATQIAANTITASQIAADTITAGQIAAGAITATELASDSVTTAKLAAGAVTASEIAANTITAGQIAANTITATEIAASTITGAKIAANTIVAGNIAAGAISATEIAAGAVTAQHMLLQSGNMISNSKFVSGDLSDWRKWNLPAQQTVVPRATAGVPTGAPTLNVAKFTATAASQVISAFSGSVAYTDAGSDRASMPMLPGRKYRVTIQAAEDATYAASVFQVIIYYRKTDGTTPSGGAVINDAVTLDSTWREFTGIFTAPADIVGAWAYVYSSSGAAGSVYWTNLSVREMAAAELVVDGTITAAKIAANTITAAQIAANTITAGQIAAGAISASELAAGAVTTAKLAAGAVTATEIAAGTITGAKIAANTITAGLLATSGLITNTAQIADGIITNAKISGALQSTNFVTGVSGWKIDKTGAAEFNALIVRSSIVDGAVTDKIYASYLGPYSTGLASGASVTILTMSIGQTLPNEIRKYGFAYEWLTNNGAVYEVHCDIRFKYAGVWGGWITKMTDTGPLTTWQAAGYSATLSGVYDDVEVRLVVYRPGSIGSPPTNFIKNVYITCVNLVK